MDALSRLTHLTTCHYMTMALFLGDHNFAGMATNMEAHTDFTSSRLFAACDRDEVVAVVEEL